MAILHRAALVLALTACSKVLGFKDVSAADGGIDPGIDGSSDAGPLVAPPNTVVGRIHVKCRQPSGDVDSATDVSQSIVQALIYDDDRRAYRTVEGVGKSDGTFRIDNVPDGATYIFRFGTLYYVTDQHVIDHSSELSRRCDPKPKLATTAIPVAWNLTGMTPVRDSFIDQAQIVSFAVQYYNSFAGMNPGETVFGPVLNWTAPSIPLTVGPYPLVDATAGDDLYVFHSRRDELVEPGGRRLAATHVLDWSQPTGVTLQDGGSASITGSFQPVAANKTVSFTVDRALFDTGYSATTQLFDFNVRIVATPALDDTLGGQALASFTLDDFSRSTDMRRSVSRYQYADPFPDSWKRYSVVEYVRSRRIPLAGGAGIVALVSNRQVAEFTTTISTAPVLQPPSNIRISGADFDLGGKIAFDGTSPVEVTWTPVLSARSYRLGVFRHVGTGRPTIAIIRTTASSIKLPADMFVGGGFYSFLLAAVRTPNDYDAGHVAQSGLPSQIADTASGLFRFSNDCGDGVVKAGEELCDTRGETAACDVDCTPSECGDGLRNAAASEACDAGGDDSPGCNSNCTLSVCGDGHANRALEDCDDGNAVDDRNGCSVNCKFNNVCGDGRVDSFVEQCDPGSAGETAMCDADCTRPQCGDDHVNPSAGEECDDGPANGTGRCSSTCTLNP